MRAARWPLVALSLLVAVAGGGCAKETYLVLEFVNRLQPVVPIHSISLELVWSLPPRDAGDGGGPRRTEQEVPEPAKRAMPLAFPLTMAFKLDERGTLVINAEGRGPAGVPVAQATASTPIKEGETWTVPVTFAPVATGAAASAP